VDWDDRGDSILYRHRTDRRCLRYIKEVSLLHGKKETNIQQKIRTCNRANGRTWPRLYWCRKSAVGNNVTIRRPSEGKIACKFKDPAIHVERAFQRLG
jgi:hypothetical protein